MNKPSAYDELQRERRMLEKMIEQALQNGIHISKDPAIIKQSQKVNMLVNRYNEENR